MYDYLIIGAGLFGTTFARQMTDAGRRCLVIDKNAHIAGHCYTESVEGIEVHMYGPHIFHTHNAAIWSYVQRFATFNHFTYRPRVNYHGRIYSFPINLMTLYQMWGVTTPQEAAIKLQQVVLDVKDKTNLEGWLLSQVGQEIYETFYRGYTEKQWGRHPATLPASIVKRIPIRLSFNDNYFEDRYQGIPIGGYTRLVAKMLDGIDVILGCDYFNDVPYFRSCAKKIVYTGPIDRFFNYRHGRLEYRSLRFEREIHSGDYQGVAAMNYTSAEVPYTRIIEHKHFALQESDITVITKEYPLPCSPSVEPFYPVNDSLNNTIYGKYKEMADSSGVLFGGRLATYKYYDMHQVIGQALSLTEKECRML